MLMPSADSNLIRWEGLLVVPEMTLQTRMCRNPQLVRVSATSYFRASIQTSRVMIHKVVLPWEFLAPSWLHIFSAVFWKVAMLTIFWLFRISSSQYWQRAQSSWVVFVVRDASETFLWREVFRVPFRRRRRDRRYPGFFLEFSDDGRYSPTFLWSIYFTLSWWREHFLGSILAGDWIIVEWSSIW